MDARVQELARAAQAGSGVNPFDIIYLRPYIEDLFDRTRLDAELAFLDEWVPANSDRTFVWHHLDRPPQSNAVVAAIWGARRWEDEWRRDSSFGPPPTVQRLAQIGVNLAAVQLQIGGAFTDEVRDHIRSRMHDPVSVWSVVHETEALISLSLKGFRCTPHFLEPFSGPELTTEWQGLPIPAQCKAKLPGAGRHIRRDLFVRLAASIARDTKITDLRRYILIEAADGLQWRDLDSIRAAAAALPVYTTEPVVVTPSPGRTFVLSSRPVEGTVTREDADTLLDSWGYYATLALGEPVDGADTQRLDVVVGVNAEPDGVPWATIRNSIDDAARQLDGGPPGFALIHTFDPEGLWPLGGNLPRWLWTLLSAKLAQYPQLLGIQVSAEPAFGAPAFGGRSEARWVVKERLLPVDIPIGSATA